MSDRSHKPALSSSYLHLLGPPTGSCNLQHIASKGAPRVPTDTVAVRLRTHLSSHPLLAFHLAAAPLQRFLSRPCDMHVYGIFDEQLGTFSRCRTSSVATPRAQPKETNSDRSSPSPSPPPPPSRLIEVCRMSPPLVLVGFQFLLSYISITKQGAGKRGRESRARGAALSRTPSLSLYIYIYVYLSLSQRLFPALALPPTLPPRPLWLRGYEEHYCKNPAGKEDGVLVGYA